MTIRNLKIWSEYYVEMCSLKKNFEIRKNDRDYKVGDYLVLAPIDKATEKFSNYPPIIRKIVYMQNFGCADGYIALGLEYCGDGTGDYCEPPRLLEKTKSDQENIEVSNERMESS